MVLDQTIIYDIMSSNKIYFHGLEKHILVRIKGIPLYNNVLITYIPHNICTLHIRKKKKKCVALYIRNKKKKVKKKDLR